jgi:hypothetical protein
MAENFTPRQAVKDLLQGTAPTRPLFLPIVFSLGARIENMPLRSFLANPTKITNALRQIRGRVRSDGITCYYDPFLEAQALGGAVEWESEDRPRGVRWPGAVINGDLPDGLLSPEDSAKSSNVLTGAEVIRRLKSLVRDDVLLMAGVTGPFALASILTNSDGNGAQSSGEAQSSIVDFAAGVVSRIASAFVEAGANLIFIREEVLPAPSAKAFSDWNSSFGTVVNIIRFYEALPILLIRNPGAGSANRGELLARVRDCIVCPVADSGETAGVLQNGNERSAAVGVALPLELFDSQDSPAAPSDEVLRGMILDGNPAVITTAGDVAATADVKRLNKIWQLLHCS